MSKETENNAKMVQGARSFVAQFRNLNEFASTVIENDDIKLNNDELRKQGETLNKQLEETREAKAQLEKEIADRTPKKAEIEAQRAAMHKEADAIINDAKVEAKRIVETGEREAKQKSLESEIRLGGIQQEYAKLIANYDILVAERDKIVAEISNLKAKLG